MQATRNAAAAAVSFGRNPMISAFAPASSLGSCGPVVVPAAAPSWVYLPRPAAPFHYSGGAGDMSLSNGLQQVQSRVHNGRVDGPFSKVDGGPTFDEALGLDLHLSLAPAEP
ncbi:hypothetical protein GH714_019148 [Hevea brasiliensis]|uniref:Uncharacterized protein n=1 Tax=Hevea brasiliensis TaxID=3981 RepID=A0A6A6N8R3_HEVBR|nr:hypothetical protein GH714_019148 [Hevea brasiliensis]